MNAKIKELRKNKKINLKLLLNSGNKTKEYFRVPSTQEAKENQKMNAKIMKSKHSLIFDVIAIIFKNRKKEDIL